MWPHLCRESTAVSHVLHEKKLVLVNRVIICNNPWPMVLMDISRTDSENSNDNVAAITTALMTAGALTLKADLWRLSLPFVIDRVRSCA